MINYPATPIDLNHLPYPASSDVQVFVGHTSGSTSATTNTYYRTWNKPKGATMVHMIAISGGGGGGGGGIGASGNNRGGGAGGGSSGIATLTIPALFLPDILYVQPGQAGLGILGSTGGAGTQPTAGSGGVSYVSYSTASSSPINILLQSNAVGPTGGQCGGVGATGTVVGAAGTIATASTGSAIGIFSSVAGQAGTAGGNTTTAGANLTAWSSIFLSGGTGSGGANNATNKGGEITPNTTTNIQNMNWGLLPTGSVALGGNGNALSGNAGVMIWQPFISSGGTGSGTNATGATSAPGGNGGIGSGGGGSSVSTTGTKGGDGGPGMVLIISW